jgi:hypothetical protein
VADVAGAEVVARCLTARAQGQPVDYGWRHRLAAEEPDVLNEEGVDPELPHRAHRGQIDGTPEDGESLFDVEE